MSSSSTNSSARVGENEVKMCYCNQVAPVLRSGTTANPGRRFWTCCNYSNPMTRCDFFCWKDDKLNDSYKNYILSSWNQSRYFQTENEELKRKLSVVEKEIEDHKKRAEHYYEAECERTRNLINQTLQEVDRLKNREADRLKTQQAELEIARQTDVEVERLKQELAVAKEAAVVAKAACMKGKKKEIRNFVYMVLATVLGFLVMKLLG